MANSQVNGASCGGVRPARRVESATFQWAKNRRGAKSIALRSSGIDLA
jgi:hypothetical protein